VPSREAGQYNTRIAFYKNTTTVDAFGEKIASWAKEQDAWAKWEPLVGRTLYQPEVDLRRSHVVVRVRHNDYTSAVDPDTVEIRKGSERYRIEGHPIDVDGMREEMVFRVVRFD
jgi:SPP1 family predicted phage head-tail adaptor